jgi:hypothetical protein
MAFRSPSTPSARRNARPVACTKLWVTRGALGRLVMMGALVGLGTPLECCSEGDSFWSDLDDPRRARHPAPVRTLPPNCLACPGAGGAWCLTCAPLPRFPEQAHASCRPWDPHLPLRQPLPSAAGRGASPSPPPCRLAERLETEAPSEPAACPAPALESRVWAACAGHVLWARGARYGMRSAFVSRQRSEPLATCPQKKMGEIEKLNLTKKEASVRKVFQNCLRTRS